MNKEMILKWVGSLDVFSAASKTFFSLNRNASPLNQEWAPGSTGWRLLETQCSSDIVLVPGEGAAIISTTHWMTEINCLLVLKARGWIQLSEAPIPSEFCEGGPLQPAPWLLGAAGAPGLSTILSVGPHFLFLYLCLSPVSLFLQGLQFSRVTAYPNDHILTWWLL